MDANDKIIRAAEYLGAILANGETYTISDSMLRRLRRGGPFAARIGGGSVVAGIVEDGQYLPAIDGIRKGEVTLVRPRNAAECTALASALLAAVEDHRPMGSSYDPAMRAGWDAWHALLAELRA